MTIAFTQKDAPASPRLPGGCWATYPDEQLGQDHVALPAGQVQRRPAVSLPAGFVHLVPGAVRQQQDDRPQVLVGRGPQQVLAQGQLRAGQGGQEELLLVLGPDPPLLLLPARASRRARSQSQGGGWRRPLCPATSLCGVCPGGRQGRGHGRDKCAHRDQEASPGKPALQRTKWVPTWSTAWDADCQAPSRPRPQQNPWREAFHQPCRGF